jgi:hypothetical protein
MSNRVIKHFNRCLIIGSGLVDVRPLVKALDTRNIEAVGLDSLAPGMTVAEAFEAQLPSIDVICAVLQDSLPSPNVYFELGLAAARKKPIFLLIEQSLQIPSDLLGFPYIRGAMENISDLSLQLDGVLAQLARPAPRRVKSTRVVTSFDAAVAHRELQDLFQIRSPKDQAKGFERWVASAFLKAGVSAATASRPEDHEPDIAIWVEGIDRSIGNPILVEIKFGTLSQSRLETAAIQLSRHMQRGSAQFGMVIYCDRQNREFQSPFRQWPPIIALSARQLIALLANGTLAHSIIQHRNLLVHGIP